MSAAILKGFMEGASLSTLSEITGQDVEAVIRAELLRIGREASTGSAVSPASPKSAPSSGGRKAGADAHRPAPKKEEPAERPFSAHVFDAIRVIGEADIAAVIDHLQRKGVTLPPGDEYKAVSNAIWGTLAAARRVVKVEGRRGYWRVA